VVFHKNGGPPPEQLRAFAAEVVPRVNALLGSPALASPGSR